MCKLEEASLNINTDSLCKFLERVSLLFSVGFGRSEIAQITSMAIRMEVDNEQELALAVEHAGQHSVLKIRLFKDDLEEIDLYFFALPELADILQIEIAKYIESD